MQLLEKSREHLRDGAGSTNSSDLTLLPGKAWETPRLCRYPGEFRAPSQGKQPLSARGKTSPSASKKASIPVKNPFKGSNLTAPKLLQFLADSMGMLPAIPAIPARVHSGNSQHGNTRGLRPLHAPVAAAGEFGNFHLLPVDLQDWRPQGGC